MIKMVTALALAVPFPQQPSTSITVTEQWTTRGPADSPFGEVSGAVAAGGSVFIADGVNKVILRYDLRARSFRRIARAGEGPGEVAHPTLMARAADDGIAVYDLGHRSILFYRHDGTPAGRTQLRGWVTNPKGFAVLKDGSFVISGGMFGNGEAIHRFDGQGGRLLTSMYTERSSEDPTVRIHIAGGPVYALEDGGFLYSNSAPHEIRAYLVSPDTSSRRIAADTSVLRAIGDAFYEPSTYQGRPVRIAQWMYAQSRGIFRLSDGTILNVMTRYYEQSSTWERWAADGRLLGRANVGRAYRPFALTERGTLIATYTDPQTDETVLTEVAWRWQN